MQRGDVYQLKDQNAIYLGVINGEHFYLACVKDFDWVSNLEPSFDFLIGEKHYWQLEYKFLKTRKELEEVIDTIDPIYIDSFTSSNEGKSMFAIQAAKMFNVPPQLAYIAIEKWINS